MDTAAASRARVHRVRLGLLPTCAGGLILLLTACSASTPTAGTGPRNTTASVVVPAITDVPDYRGALSRQGVMPGPAPVGRAVPLWKHLSPSGQSWPVAIAGGWAFES